MAAVLFICALGQPLVLAHLNGFTAIGLHASGSARSAMLGQIKALCSVPVTAAHIFMIGPYLAGAELFTAPVDFAPEPHTICRSCAQRVARGTTLAWCTLAALQGTPLSDAATRAFATTEMFRGPSTSLPDAPADGVRFDFEASSAAQSVARRPADERTAPAWSAPQRMLQQDDALVSSLLGSVSSGDSLLDGWAERVQPLDASSGPRELLGHAPSFDGDRLDGIPLSPPPAPLRLPWLPRPPLQKPAAPDPPACPTILDIIPSEEARAKAERWFQASLADLTSIRDQLAAGVPPAGIYRARRQAIAIGQSETAEWARDRVWDCRGECCVLSDFHAAPDTHLDLAYLERRLRHYPDQFLAANILEGVRLDADVELQSVWVPHLTSLPLWIRLRGQGASAPPLAWVVRVLLQPPFSGSCTSTARGRRRASWSRTGSGAPPRATDRAPPPSTPPASRPSPSMRPPTSTRPYAAALPTRWAPRVSRVAPCPRPPSFLVPAGFLSCPVREVA